MRLWSIHPQHLDAKGLVALWREALLAKHVLEGKTKGYRNHPQLDRFKKLKRPLDAINQYLGVIYEEAGSRGYTFNSEKFDPDFKPVSINVTSGQIRYETEHLLKKLKVRDPEKYAEMKKKKTVNLHPMFKRIRGKIEEWEIVD
jgi:hypothetical protein